MTMTNSMKTVLRIIYLGISGLTLSACATEQPTGIPPATQGGEVPVQNLPRPSTTQPHFTVAQGINEFATVL